MSDDTFYFNSRRPTIGNQDIELDLSVKGNAAKVTGYALIRAIDDVLNRLRVTQATAEVIKGE